MAPPGGTTLAKPVDVGDTAQVVQRKVLAGSGRFPDGTFGRFSVTHQHVGTIVGTNAASVQGDTDRGADPLSQRAGGDVDEGKTRGRVPLEVAVQLAQPQHVGPVNETRSAQAA